MHDCMWLQQHHIRQDTSLLLSLLFDGSEAEQNLQLNLQERHVSVLSCASMQLEP